MPNENPDDELTPPAKLAILRYLSVVFTPPAIIASILAIIVSILAFFLGLIVRDGAMKDALSLALVEINKETLKPIVDASDAVKAAKKQAEDAATHIREIATRAEKDAKKAQETARSAEQDSATAKQSAIVAQQTANNSAKIAEDLLKTIQNVKGLQEAIQSQRDLVATVATAVKNEVYKGLPTITLLTTGNQYVFVNQGTGEPKPSIIQDMPAGGVTVECKDIVPFQARGVIIAALLLAPVNHTNAVFMCSDENGSFYEPRNGQALNGIYNYTSAWIGGILFCSFLNDTKQFKYLMGSEGGTPDKTVRCRGAVIGWF